MDKLLTADEVAELLKVNTEWVWAQARAGRIPHVRLGRYRRFRGFRTPPTNAVTCSLRTSCTSADVGGLLHP
jgi:excisionase family DNA binding protein